jgi:hypothetical protein
VVIPPFGFLSFGREFGNNESLHVNNPLARK